VDGRVIESANRFMLLARYWRMRNPMIVLKHSLLHCFGIDNIDVINAAMFLYVFVVVVFNVVS
jgi:hypothetical protein